MTSNEISVLFNPSILLSGDAYLGNSNLDNFAYWGRNLAQSSGNGANSDAFWALGNYVLNEEAQSTFDSDQTEDYFNKVTRLKGEGKTIPWPLGASIHLQSSELNTASVDQSSEYPDGKVWAREASSTVLGSVTYNNSGTIIFDGDLVINSGSVIAPASDSDQLGIIVTGNLTIGSNCKIKAAILSLNNISLGNNNELIGSFVSNTFNNLSSNQSNKFYYDYGFENNWPPGFKYLKMPQPE